MKKRYERIRPVKPVLSSITLHSPEDFASMRRVGQLAATCLDIITPYVRPGVTTNELDRLCAAFIAANGGLSAPLGYKGFPKSICTSVNNVVCHGIPNDQLLLEGDIINIDVTPILNSWHGDASRMYHVGKVCDVAAHLTEVTYEALMQGVATVRPGATLGDIGYTIQAYVEAQNFSVVRDFCGHGVGRVFHAPPNVMHFGIPSTGVTLCTGMIFTIEPMVNVGKPETRILTDGWTAVTEDHSLSAQFEHTVGVTSDGYEIFTLSPKNWHKPPYL